MKIKTYTREEWERHCATYPTVRNDELTVVYDGDWICADMRTAHCIQSKTAVRRFLDALETIRPGVKDVWFDEMSLCAKRIEKTGGYMNQDGLYYHFGIDNQSDDEWYIFLNEKEV